MKNEEEYYMERWLVDGVIAYNLNYLKKMSVVERDLILFFQDGERNTVSMPDNNMATFLMLDILTNSENLNADDFRRKDGREN